MLSKWLKLWSRNSIVQSPMEKSTPPMEPTPPVEHGPSKVFSFLDSKLKAKINSPRTDAVILLRQHLETQNEPETCDPLKYWKTRADIYESLQQVALKYLCVPGTSCESERCFSKAGQIVSDRRTRLEPDVVDKLMFINKNQDIFP
ncbi:zinc finger BED domain-containing protein 4-like [Drosophila biarmipes]|uniref:zinc finger BED domain-containing protein 4-like n=1 Tax=Drosophila biarmipes TaxID=125945 RepID=UPI0021CC610A|nr:zinc finger BED domain-containing protein 4-like [Drosophila biarmipes]